MPGRGWHLSAGQKEKKEDSSHTAGLQDPKYFNVTNKVTFQTDEEQVRLQFFPGRLSTCPLWFGCACFPCLLDDIFPSYDMFTALNQPMLSVAKCSVKTNRLLSVSGVTQRERGLRANASPNNIINCRVACEPNVHQPRNGFVIFSLKWKNSVHELNSLFNNSLCSNNAVPPPHISWKYLKGV